MDEISIFFLYIFPLQIVQKQLCIGIISRFYSFSQQERGVYKDDDGRLINLLLMHPQLSARLRLQFSGVESYGVGSPDLQECQINKGPWQMP